MNLSLEKFIPHRAPWILLTQVLNFDSKNLWAEVLITKESMGFKTDGVPAWYGVEYIAQAIAAFNGMVLQAKGSQPEIGFLVGVRQYKTSVERFKLGARLEISVEVDLLMESSGVFWGRIKEGGELIAQGQVTTYKPAPELIVEMKGKDL